MKIGLKMALKMGLEMSSRTFREMPSGKTENLRKSFLKLIFFTSSLFGLATISLPCLSEPMPISRMMIYGDEVNTRAEWEAVSEASFAFWDHFVEKGLSQSTFRISPDKKYTAEFLLDGDVPYLRIRSTENGKTYYHFADHTKSQERFTSGYMVENIDVNRTNFERLMSLVEMAGGELEALSNWEDSSLKTISEVEVLYRGLLKSWHSVRQANSMMSDSEFFAKFINTNQIYFHHELFGSAELNAIEADSSQEKGKKEKIPFIRIVHKETAVAFLVMESDTINLKGPHFQQYLARQHIAAGTGRTDGEHGRDVVLVQVPTFREVLRSDLVNPESYQAMPRHRRYSGAWWRDYWLAIKKLPTLSTTTLGVISGFAQGATAMAMAGAVKGVALAGVYLGVDGLAQMQFPHAMETAQTAFIYGSAFGMIASMFKNWERLPAKPWVRTLKVMSNSLLFYYILTFVVNGADFHQFMTMLDPTTHEGLLRNLMIVTAAYLGNRSKPIWYNLATIREKIGLSRGEARIGSVGLGWSRSVLEYQIAYLPNFVFRLIERMVSNGGNTLTVAGAGVMLLQVPFAEWAVMKFGDYYYRKTGHPGAKEIADEARQSLRAKIRFFTQPSYAAGIVKEYLVRQKNKVVSFVARKQPNEITKAFVVPKTSPTCAFAFAH